MTEVANSVDMLRGYEQLRERIKGHLLMSGESKKIVDNTSNLINMLEREVQSVKIQREQLVKTWKLLRDLQDLYSEQSIRMLKDLLNKGLKTIFHDRQYEVKFHITDTKKKKLKMLLMEKMSDGQEMETDLFSGVMLTGGGVLTVVSFIFQVFLIVMYEKRRVLFADEAFAQLSTSYVENFFAFLKYLHTDMGFDFMFVVHDPRFMPYMDRVYRVTMGKYQLVEEQKENTDGEARS